MNEPTVSRFLPEQIIGITEPATAVHLAGIQFASDFIAGRWGKPTTHELGYHLAAIGQRVTAVAEIVAATRKSVTAAIYGEPFAELWQAEYPETYPCHLAAAIGADHG